MTKPPLGVIKSPTQGRPARPGFPPGQGHGSGDHLVKVFPWRAENGRQEDRAGGTGVQGQGHGERAERLARPWLGPRQARGRTHSSRASPGAGLRSWLVGLRPRLKTGRGFPQVPSPGAAAGTCPTQLVRGGAGERHQARTSGQQRSPLAQDAWNAGCSRSCLGAPGPPEGRR